MSVDYSGTIGFTYESAYGDGGVSKSVRIAFPATGSIFGITDEFREFLTTLGYDYATIDSALTDDYSDSNDDFELADLRDEISTLEEENTQLENDYAEASDENDRLESRVIELERQLEASQNLLTEAVSQLKSAPKAAVKKRAKK